jgi:hypothetical protein
MEVIHTVRNGKRKFQLWQDGDRYRLAWGSEKPSMCRLSGGAIIGWALMPSSSDVFREMDKFILGYFPEGLVALVALETA